MRTLCLAVFASSILFAQSPEAARELDAAQKPVETWMGSRLVIYEDAPSKLPASQSPAVAPRVIPKEAQLTAGSIRVTMSQMRAFQSSQQLAEFLAQAAAHARLGHSERLVALAKAMGILAPDRRAAGVLESETRAQLEKEVEPVAAEFMETAGCAPGPCAMFGLLLQAARRP